MANRKDRRAGKNNGKNQDVSAGNMGDHARAMVELHHAELASVYRGLLANGCQAPALVLIEVTDEDSAWFGSQFVDDVLAPGQTVISGRARADLLRAFPPQTPVGGLLRQIGDDGVTVLVVAPGVHATARISLESLLREDEPPVEIDGADERAALAEKFFDSAREQIGLAKRRGITALNSVVLILDPKDIVGRHALEAIGPACGLDVNNLDDRTIGVVVVPRGVVRKAMASSHPGIVAHLDNNPPDGLFHLVTISHGGASLGAVIDAGPMASGAN
jgi:hypothetical protein